ncbi:MAG: T9SS type A sorting domain-containing protein [Calditrichaeota bacterium]|nr:T9SS type A sorting domain-containing protein [Calditrichota bacterium]
MLNLKNFILAVILLWANIQAQTYNWPAKPFNIQDHSINGTFCENRPDGSVLRDHFHDGVDIGLGQGGEVYSVINGTVTSLTRTGVNAYIRVGRYAYVHVTPNPALDIGDNVVAYQTIIGTTNDQNHIHFKDGYSGSEINAIRSTGGLSPLVDNYSPTIVYIKYFINKTTQQFSNNRVSGLVDIVSQAYDRTNDGYSGSNNGVYRVSYQIFDSTGTEPVTAKITPYKFDQIPSHSYVTNVFFEGSDLSTYIYNITNKVTGDSYWDTRNVDRGFYQVKVEVEDTRNNITEKWSTVEVVPQDKTAPDTPELLALIGNNEKNWTLNWFKNDSTDLDGYNLSFTYWGDSWNENPSISGMINPADTSFTWNNFANNVSIFFRLVAHDDAGPTNFSDSSDVYGIRLADSGPQALIVDGFDRTDGYWNKKSHMFSMYYGLALTDLSIPFNTTSDDALRLGQVNLYDYPRIFYMLGDEQYNEKPFEIAEQTQIEQFLQGNGMLLISGNRIGKAMASSYPDFYSNNLHATYSGLTTVPVDSVFGVEGTPFEDFKAAIKSPSDSAMTMEVLNPLADSQLILKYNNSEGAAVYKARNSGGEHSSSMLIYMGFPYELIVSQEKRNQFIDIISKMDPTALENLDNTPTAPEKFVLEQNYPNPFNPTTTIRFAMAKSGFVNLKIYDRAGRLVRILFNGSRSAGSHQLVWDGKNDSGQEVSSGVYFLRMKGSDFSFMKKMMLLR